MPNDDPFTLDLFGKTSLSSGLGLGVNAFGTTIEPPEEHDFRMPEPKRAKVNGTSGGDTVVMPKTRPDVTRKGIEMIGDFRTDALHEALGRAPIEDDTLMALLVLTFAGQNVRVDSANGGGDDYYFAPDRDALGAWLASNTVAEEVDEPENTGAEPDDPDHDDSEGFREAAE